MDRRLRSHEVFVLNPRTRSIDSRYLGPIHRTNVERVEPLWTWKNT
jgi:type IV secretory pathway protease TraF